jgi:carboxymethylenebutenolidase
LRRAVLVVLGLTLAAVPFALARHQERAPGDDAPPRARRPGLPPGAQGAARALDTSPRHGEWVDVPSSATPIRSFVVYPERADKAPVVIVIHEIYGLTDWVRAVADQLAADGFIAVAPDMASGVGPGGGGTDSLAGRDEVVRAIGNLSIDEASRGLDAVRAWALEVPAASGTIATVGFGWGGRQSFHYATHQPGLDAAVVFYGTSPPAERLADVHAPVLGLYGGDDARVDATIEPATKAMRSLGKVYETEVYEGAGHGFMRQQVGRKGANARAAAQAWPRAVAFLRAHTGDAR